MPKRNLLVMVLVVLSFGVIVAGCGDDDSTSATTVSVDDTDATTTEDSGETTVEATDTTSSDSGDNPVDADAFYEACINAVEGTPAEAAGTTGCDQAKVALEQCGEQAVASGSDEIADTAIKACQDTADQAVEQLESLGG